MHGNNVKRPKTETPGSLQVQDVWYTIQGEGPWAGQPATFIRLTGCNLACWFCDTVWDDDKDPFLTPGDILRRVKTCAPAFCKKIVITGGEPARQDLSQLLPLLTSLGYDVQIETAGILWQDCFYNDNVLLVCSPKTKNVHHDIKLQCNHWKYVIRAGDTDALDGLPVSPMQRVAPMQDKLAGGSPCRPPKRRGVIVYLQACDEGENKEATLRNHYAVAASALKFGYTAGVQMHKILGVD